MVRAARILFVLTVTIKGGFCSDSSSAGAANEGVLANFFNSLLSKKTGSPGSPGSGAVGAGVQGSAKKTGINSNNSIHCFSPPVSQLSSQQDSRCSLAPCQQIHTVKPREGRNDGFLRLCAVFLLSFAFVHSLKQPGKKENLSSLNELLLVCKSLRS